MGKVTAWSFSRYLDYEKCPFKFKCKYIDKIQEPPSPALDKGRLVHKKGEDYLTAPIATEVPKEYVQFQDQMVELRNLTPLVEQKWALNANWQPTGWFDRDAWLRIVTDACVAYGDGEVEVIDHKTGRQYDYHQDQMEIFACGAAFYLKGPVEKVTTRLWYLDSGHEEIKSFTFSECEELSYKWEDKPKAMLNDDVFAPRPGSECKWCFYARSKNGPCKFG